MEAPRRQGSSSECVGSLERHKACRACMKGIMSLRRRALLWACVSRRQHEAMQKVRSRLAFKMADAAGTPALRNSRISSPMACPWSLQLCAAGVSDAIRCDRGLAHSGLLEREGGTAKPSRRWNVSVTASGALHTRGAESPRAPSSSGGRASRATMRGGNGCPRNSMDASVHGRRRTGAVDCGGGPVGLLRSCWPPSLPLSHLSS